MLQAFVTQSESLSDSLENLDRHTVAKTSARTPLEDAPDFEPPFDVEQRVRETSHARNADFWEVTPRDPSKAPRTFLVYLAALACCPKQQICCFNCSDTDNISTVI